MGIELGHQYRFGIKKNTGAWGAAAVALGATDQFECNSDSFKANVEKIMNNGVFGTPYRRGGSPGPNKPAGDVVADLYYRDAAWRAIAAAFGADTVTALGGGAHRHDISIANAMGGVNWTVIAAGNEGVREIPCAKIPGIKLRWESEGDGSRGKLTPSIIGFDMNLNVGSPNSSLVVATAAAANGVKTIAAQPPTPSPITLTLTGVTELVTTIVYENIRGDQVTEVHTRSTGGLTYTTLQYARKVVSITCASIGGAGNFSAGVSNGVNNATTIASLTSDTERFPILFSQLEFFINEQEGADFGVSGSADEQYLSSFEIGLTGSMDQRVTTEFGYRISEPSLGGGGWPTFSASFSHSAFTDRNRRHFFDALGKRQLKAKAVFTGPPISGASVPYSLTIWLNGLQVNEADPNVGGPGVIALEAPSEPSTVLTSPTGFPASTTGACLIQLVNTLSTSYLA